MEDAEGKEGFKVSDKRSFTADGDKKDDETAVEQEPAAEEKTEESIPETDRDAQAEDQGAYTEAPPMDFSRFVMSLASTALFQMGIIRGPEEGDPMPKDLDGASQIIDILGILQEKTKGNLTDEEENLLRDALYQLRIAFVEASK